MITALHPFPQELAPQLVQLLRARPGPNTVRLNLSDGQELKLTGTSGVGPEDEAEVSVLIGGATVRYDEASVDLAALGAGVIALWKSEQGGTASTPARSTTSAWTKATSGGY